MKTAMKKQTGFTLIELIMVIVILGILAATALPKFVNLGADARTAAIKAAESSMRSTNAIVYARANIDNKMTSSNSVTINGQTVATAFGYASSVADMKKIMDLSSDFDATSAPSGTNGIIYHTGAQTIATCAVSYVQATSSVAPQFQAFTNGC